MEKTNIFLVPNPALFTLCPLMMNFLETSIERPLKGRQREELVAFLKVESSSSSSILTIIEGLKLKNKAKICECKSGSSNFFPNLQCS